MNLFEWTDSFLVGIEEFDSHHKHLVQLINELNNSIVAGNDDILIERVLAELTNYSLYHFRGEEDAMEKHGFHAFGRHKEEHLFFVGRVLDFMNDLTREQSGVSQNVLDFLKEWLTHHVLHTDKEYVPFLHERGVR